MTRIARALAVLAIAWSATTANARVPGIDACPTDQTGGRIVVDATVTSVEYATYTCAPGGEALDEEWGPLIAFTEEIAVTSFDEAPTPGSGCLVVVNSPWCGGKIEMGAYSSRILPPDNIAVSIDGVARNVSTPNGVWQACGLAPGTHEVTGCARTGRFACHFDIAAGARTIVEGVRIEPRLHLRVERARLGTVRPGTELTVAFDDKVPGGDLDGAEYFDAPSSATLTWRAGDATPRARMCEAPAAPPGCSRCSTSELAPGTLVIGAIVIAGMGWPRRRARKRSLS